MDEGGKIKFEMATLDDMHECLLKCAETLERSGLSRDDVFKVRLVSTELVSNVIQHGHEIAVFECATSPGAVTVTVTAKSQEFLVFEAANLPGDPFATRGRGMYLIRRYASITHEGKTVTAFIKTGVDETK